MKHYIDNFKGKKVLVVGDLMLDKSIWGNAERISPEAPVQIVDVQKETYAPGGAANTASNIAALGGNVFLVGLVGNDEAKKILQEELGSRFIYTSGIITDPNRPTIQKIRVIGKNQQLLRIDYEDRQYCDGTTCEHIKNYIRKIIKEIEVVVISDYAKGLITEELVRFVVDQCKEHNKQVVVDPKPKHVAFYKDVTLITPNHQEAGQMTQVEETGDKGVEEMGSRLTRATNANMLITRGEKGMTLFEKSNGPLHIQTQAKAVYDVTGAGDTVVGVVALALAAGANLRDAAVIANHAAGIVVGKVGTSTVTVDELRSSLDDDHE